MFVCGWCALAGYEKLMNKVVPSVQEAVEARREPLSNLWTAKKEPQRPVLVRVAYMVTENGEYAAAKAKQGWNAAVEYFN
jgi:hypothetical protein